jgi:RHS repeat-associated protein
MRDAAMFVFTDPDTNTTLNLPQLRIAMPDGQDLLFRATDEDALTYVPAASVGAILDRVNDDFTLTTGNGSQYGFKRRLNSNNSNVFYRIESSQDAEGRGLSYHYNNTNDTLLRRVEDASGRYLRLIYQNMGAFLRQQGTLGTSPHDATQGQWHEITVTNSASWRYLALFNANDHRNVEPLPISEIEFYDENDQLISGTAFGSEPAYAVGEEFDKAFDGDTGTYARYAYRRNGYLGIDAGSNVTVSRIRYFIPSGVVETAAAAQFVGLREAANNNFVIKEVEASDGRIIEYNYSIHTDASGFFRWVILDGVDYPDGTAASYGYTQIHDFTQPVLSYALDPRYMGSLTAVEYDFNLGAAVGFVSAEKSGINGEVIAQTGNTGAHKPQVIWANGAVKEATFQLTNARLTNYKDAKGRTRSYGYDQENNGYMASRTEPGGRTTTYTRTLLGSLLTRSLPDGTEEVWTRDSRERELIHTITAPGYAARTTSHTYDGAGRRTRTDHPDGTFELWTYNAYGQTLSHTRRDGTEELWTYDSSGRKLSFTDAGGHSTSYSYNALDLVETKTDALNRTTTLAYNDRGQITSIIHPDATSTSTAYDDFGNVIAQTNELAETRTFTYNEFRQKLTETDALGRTVSFSYAVGSAGAGSGGCGCNTQAKPTLVTLPSGRQIVNTFDLLWNITTTTTATGTADEAITRYFYDTLDRLIRVRDPLNRDTHQTYDLRDRVASVTDIRGLITTFGYDGFGNLVSTTTPAGGTSTLVYDSMNRLVSQTNALSQSSTYSYDSMGRLISVTSPEGRVTVQTYTLDGLPATITNAFGTADAATMTYFYDAVHRRTASRNPLGQDTLYDYDLRDRVVMVTDPLNRSTSMIYNGAGRLIATTNPDNTTISRTYDAAGQLVATTDELGQVTQYAYDADGRQASLTDPRGNARQWSYDTTGRLWRKMYPDNTSEEYTYRKDGSLLRRKIPGGAQETYAYNPQGQLISRSWPAGHVTPNVAYTYDAAGRPATVTNGQSSTSWSYDLLDRKIAETQTNPSIAGDPHRTVAYGYDADGHLAAITYPDGHVVEYAWNARDELGAITADGPPPLAQYSYDLAGRVTGLVRENGLATTRGFDVAGQLLTQEHTVQSTALDSVAYTLDARGRRTGVSRPGGKNDTYGYDATGQVTAAAFGATAGPATESFQYDLAGNRTNSTGLFSATYNANALDQYTQVGGKNQINNINGNVTTLRQPGVADVFMTWDGENRLLSMHRNGGANPGRIENVYDVQHRRILKRVFASNGSGGWTLAKSVAFTYDDWNVIEEREYNANGELTHHLRHTWGADVSGSLQGAGGVGGLVMSEELDTTGNSNPPVPHYFWYDGNGNVTGIVDGAGSVEATYRYTSFGAMVESSTSTSFAQRNAMKFSTKYHDPEVEPIAGTYYYGYRHFLPSTGRWPSRDPIGEEGGVNLYGMVGNALIGSVDLLGLKIDCVKAGAELWKDCKEPLPPAPVCDPDGLLEWERRRHERVRTCAERIAKFIKECGKHFIKPPRLPVP